ncbi:winged helix-turn-helix transcriptional regulator [Chelativorans salis]|uniref:Helix-turn-helix transcriptional regulator n=1 Tax=Chelativorans salis TaxID=2978478 RepID=A0ABT2LHR1_9HYPH|nr:helix-turn-helix domain-containing protein [Chelativorans sp. EGI FJ00035]MCT7374107.1 helix-turn-helix transcriptional regulator [Chelativorans sp. EGI FJ00035]
MEYGQLCPLAKAAEILAERWTFLVIRELLSGSARFNEIRRGIPLISPSLLSQRLQRLEREGLVRREPSGSGHLYHLTEAGQELAPIVHLLSQWGERWVLGHIDTRKPDVTALMWALRRRVDPSAFGKRRVTVQFEFTDQPQAKRCWWLVNQGTNVDLCPKDPGFEVDLYVITDLPTMARIWVGKLQLSAAIDIGTLELSGPRSLCQTFCSWLLLSPFAQREAADPEQPSAGAGLAVGPNSGARKKSCSTRGATLSAPSD